MTGAAPADGNRRGGPYRRAVARAHAFRFRHASRRARRRLLALPGAVAVLGLLLSVQASGTSASAAGVSTGVTRASAAQVLNAYLTVQKVAQATHNELLALSDISGAQYAMTAGQFAIEAGGGPAVPGPVYGRPTLYVPALTTYPLWFMATVPEHPATGGPAGTALMVFEQQDTGSSWAIVGSAQLDPGAAPLKVAKGPGGYVTALNTHQAGLLVEPDEVGALQATVADDGPSSAAMAAVAAGPHTTGLYQANAALKNQYNARNQFYQWELEGSSYPPFAIRTADGGALVFYTMGMNTVAEMNGAAGHSHPYTKMPIPVPAGFRPLLSSTRIHHELNTSATDSFVALDPPATAKHGKIRVTGALIVPTYAAGD